MHSKFSQKQLNDFKQRLLFDQTKATFPKCRQCVGGPADELTCHRCDLTKGLNAFTKVQRRYPDKAVGWLLHWWLSSANNPFQLCKDCQQEVDDVEPNIEDALQEQQILETQTSIGSHVNIIISRCTWFETNVFDRVSTTSIQSADLCRRLIPVLASRMEDLLQRPLDNGKAIFYVSALSQALPAAKLTTGSGQAKIGMSQRRTTQFDEIARGTKSRIPAMSSRTDLESDPIEPIWQSNPNSLEIGPSKELRSQIVELFVKLRSSAKLKGRCRSKSAHDTKKKHPATANGNSNGSTWMISIWTKSFAYKVCGWASNTGGTRGEAEAEAETKVEQSYNKPVENTLEWWG